MILWLLFLFTFTGLSIKQTYAFYDNTVKAESEIISIGEWIFSIEWEEGQSYTEGTIVEYNGELYIRTNRGNDTLAGIFSPDSWLGWIFWERN